MSKYPNISEETAAMQRQEWQDTGPQDRYAGSRLKFAWNCLECGSNDGMQAVCRETLEDMAAVTIQWLAGKYRQSGNTDKLFYPCHFCNPKRSVPDGLLSLTVAQVMKWLDRDPMTPDYDALAAEEPVSQTGDSRDAAGLER